MAVAGPTPAGLTRAEARASCDAAVARTARPLLGVTAGLLASFALVTPLVTPWPGSLWIAGGQAVLAVGFLSAHLVLRRGGWAIRAVHPMFALLTAGALASVVITYLGSGNALLTAGVVLLILGAGIVVLSWPWLLVILAMYTVGWIATLAVTGTPPFWEQLVLTLAAADMLAVMAHAARYQTHLRLEALRRHDGHQRQVLEEGLRALRETEERLRSVVRAAPVILLATDAEGRVTLAEGRGLVARGWDGAGLVGQLAPEFLEVLPEERDRLLRALRGESSSGVSERAGRVFETFWTPVLDEDGRSVGAICVAIDVTERVRAQDEERRSTEREAAIARLQEMDRFKTALLNTASHELNTPLTPIKLQMHLLKRSVSEMDPRHQRAIALLDRNVDRLATLVSDIMDVARLQGGQLRIVSADTDLVALAQEAAATYEALAASRKIDLRSEATGAVLVHADPRRLLQIIFNLLGNALKFTPEGGRVTLRATVRDGRAVVQVQDTGPGMTEEQMGRLFRPFSQVHDQSTAIGGTGLGLYISRGIAEQHGGTLGVASDGPGKGASFTLTLPLAAPTPRS